MLHRYYFLNRPPFIGTHPRGEVAREVWQPVQRIPLEHGGPERVAHGWVEYDHPLPPASVAQYELWPAQAQERGQYTLRLIREKVNRLPNDAEIFRIVRPVGYDDPYREPCVVHNRDKSIKFQTPFTPEIHAAMGALSQAFFMGVVGDGELELIVDAPLPQPDWRR